MPAESSQERRPPKHDLTSLNAELISHGWIKRPLSLNGLSERELGEVIGAIYEVVGSAIVCPCVIHRRGKTCFREADDAE